MPTVLRQDGFAAMIYTHDHLPEHIHVFKGESEVIINLHDITVSAVYEMSGRDVRRAQEIVAENQKFLLSEWERIRPIP